MICSVCGYEGEARVEAGDGYRHTLCAKCGAWGENPADEFKAECQEYIKAWLGNSNGRGNIPQDELTGNLVALVRARQSAVRELMGIKEGE